MGLSPVSTVPSQPAPRQGATIPTPPPPPKAQSSPLREAGVPAGRPALRGLCGGRPSADVRAIIIISPPPDGMVRVAPSSACQAPLRGPRGQELRAPACELPASSPRAPGPTSAWAWPPARAAFLQVQGPKWLSASDSSAGHLRQAEAVAGVAQHS